MVKKARETLDGAVFLHVRCRASLIMFSLVASSLFKATMQDGVLVMTLDSFENSDNKDYNGEICDAGHWGRIKYCDPYFIFCVTDFRDPTSAASCPLLKQQTSSWTNTGNVDFKSTQLRVNFKIWKGYAGLHIVAMDDDPAGNSDDLIDKFTTTIVLAAPANGTFSLERSLLLQGKQSTFKLRVKVRCQVNFFGADCARHCRARDNGLEGHYSCNMSGEKVCHNDWYGPDCRRYCLAQNGTNGHYECNKFDGSKICYRNWYGPECMIYCLAQNDTTGHYQCNSTNGRKICHKNWYGLNCATNCIPKNDASGHYRCGRANGTKICVEGWYSDNCTVYCRERNDSFGHYKCDAATGGKVCRYGWYDKNCTTYCVPKNDSFGAYTCDERNGDRICGNGWFGTYCSKYCIPRNNTQGHYECDDNNGSKICNENWFGENCTRYCISRNDSLGHYWCDSTSGRKLCYFGWYGENCQVYCLENNDTGGHFSCDATTGARKCLLGWFGSECDVYCVEQSNSEGHFSCHNETGERICRKGWYGYNCSTFCIPRNDSRGHYDCNETDGNKICHKDWYGLNCTLRGTILTSTQYKLKASASFSTETQMSLQSSANWSIGDVRIQGSLHSLLSLRTSVKTPFSTKLKISAWRTTSSGFQEQSLHSVLLPTECSVSRVPSETDSRNTRLELHPSSQTEYAIESSASFTYPQRFTLVASEIMMMSLSETNMRSTLSIQPAELSKTQGAFYATNLLETVSSSLHKVPEEEISLQSTAIKSSLSLSPTYLHSTPKLESKTIQRTLPISETLPIPVTSLLQNTWGTNVSTSKVSLTSSIWLEVTKSIDDSATKPQPVSSCETLAVSPSVESLSAVEASSVTSLSMMSAMIMPITYSVLQTVSHASISTMTSQGLPPTTVSLLETGKADTQGSGTWLLRTAAGKATLSIIICVLGISAIVMVLYSYHKRKQKKQVDCKDMKWEGYLNTLAEVGCQNGIKNQAVEVDDYLFRENPIYGLENDASVSSAGQKWDNQLFYDVALNNGESAV